MVKPCEWCQHHGYTCTVFSEKIKGDICAYCKRNEKSPCNAGQSGPANDITAPSVMAGDVLHQISVHYGVSDVRQLVQIMEDKDSAKDASISSLRQEIIELKEGFYRLQDTVVGQQCPVNDKTPLSTL